MHTFVCLLIRSYISTIGQRILTKAAWQSCHPSQLRIHSSDLDPYLKYIAPWVHLIQPPKRHLDQFWNFLGITNVTKTHTHTNKQTHTRRLRYSVCSNSPHHARIICNACDVAHENWKLHIRISPNLLCTLHMAVARSSIDDSAIRYVLPILWMTSCLVRPRQCKVLWFHNNGRTRRESKATHMFPPVRQVAASDEVCRLSLHLVTFRHFLHHSLHGSAGLL